MPLALNVPWLTTARCWCIATMYRLHRLQLLQSRHHLDSRVAMQPPAQESRPTAEPMTSTALRSSDHVTVPARRMPPRQVQRAPVAEPPRRDLRRDLRSYLVTILLALFAVPGVLLYKLLTTLGLDLG